VVGGTALYRYVAAPEGTAARLGRAGILVREFPFAPDRLRFGLPPDQAALGRLAGALA
jgi:cobalamin biosynthetic protein CobC